MSFHPVPSSLRFGQTYSKFQGSGCSRTKPCSPQSRPQLERCNSEMLRFLSESVSVKVTPFFLPLSGGLKRHPKAMLRNQVRTSSTATSPQKRRLPQGRLSHHSLTTRRIWPPVCQVAIALLLTTTLKSERPERETLRDGIHPTIMEASKANFHGHIGGRLWRGPIPA